MEEPMAPTGGIEEPRIVDEEVADAPQQAAEEEDELAALLGEGEEGEEGEGGELPEAAGGDPAAQEAGRSPDDEAGEASRVQLGRSTDDGAGSQQHGEPHHAEGIKLFLGGLSWDTSEETLREHFGRYGRVLKAEVMRDRNSGTPRGFGFVTFADETAAEEVTQMKHILDGRQIDAKRSVPQGTPTHKPKSRKIFVGGLAPDTTDDQFHEYFSQFGEVSEAQIMQDHVSGRSRGFGFVTFGTESAVEKVFHGGFMHTVAGKQVEVKTATPRGQHGQAQRDGSRGGGRNAYGGGPRGRSEPFGQRGGGGGSSGGRGGGDRGMMGGGMMPPGMMGAYGMMPPAAYGMGGYGGMGFPGPYGAYSGMMMQQMGAYGYPAQGYGGNFGYGAMGYGGGMQPEQLDSYAANGPPDGNGAMDQGGQGSRYHPYSSR